MEVGEIIQNGGLVLGGGAVVKAFDFLTAWWKSKQPVSVKQPVEIDLKKEFVTRRDFDAHVLDNKRDLAAHVADNNRDHENMFARLNANDKLTSGLEGLLTGMRDDLSAIKNKLFKTK